MPELLPVQKIVVVQLGVAIREEGAWAERAQVEDMCEDILFDYEAISEMFEHQMHQNDGRL